MEIIQAEELNERMLASEHLNLIDVRQPEEHLEFNIGGQLIPLGEILAMQIDAIEDLKDKEIICYCRSGQRSMQACMMLETMGFINVKNLAGGMLGWETKFGRR
jgi:rhodanese-related sulfurtransferase